MGVREWLVPREKRFFDMLESQADLVVRAAEALVALFADYRDVGIKRGRIKQIEHEGDAKVHAIYEALNRTFVTPIDREDIQALASDLDNILDMIDAAATRLDLYGIQAPSKGMVDLATVILEQVRMVRKGVAMIRDMKNADQVERISVEINRLENVADDLMNNSIAELFRLRDAVEIIKQKEIVENLEVATDYCEDVADHLSDIVAKNR